MLGISASHLSDIELGRKTVSAERAHAARVAESEAAKMRDMKERQKVRRTEDGKKEGQVALRAARKTADASESRIAESERQIVDPKRFRPEVLGNDEDSQDSSLNRLP